MISSNKHPKWLLETVGLFAICGFYSNKMIGLGWHCVRGPFFHWRMLARHQHHRVASNWAASLAWTATRASGPLCIIWRIIHRLDNLFTAIHPCLGFCFVVLSFPGSNSFLIRAGRWDFVRYWTTTTVHQLYQLAALKHVRPRWNVDFRGFLMKKQDPIPTANYFFGWVRPS